MSLFGFGSKSDKTSKDFQQKKIEGIDKIIKDVIKEQNSIEIEINGVSGSFFSNVSHVLTDNDKKYLLIKTFKLPNPDFLQKTGKDSSITVYLKAYDKLLKFTSQFLEKFEDNVKLIKIRYPVDIVSEQRRNYFRIAPSKENPVRILLTQIGTEDISDISGGGLAFFSDKKILEEGNTIKNCRITLPNSKKIVVSCIVTNVLSKGKNIKYGLKFIDINSTDQETIVNYVNERQRERNRT